MVQIDRALACSFGLVVGAQSSAGLTATFFLEQTQPTIVATSLFFFGIDIADDRRDEPVFLEQTQGARRCI